MDKATTPTIDPMQYLGWKYKDRGRDRGAVDCFGLFLVVASDMGYDVNDFDYGPKWYEGSPNRLWDGFRRHTKSVAEEELRPGDVVLLRSTGGYMNHVGVVAEPNKFLHCTRGTGVVLSRLDLFRSRIVGFYRLYKDVHDE